MKPVQIVGMRPVWGLQSPSPFCLKLEAWLRIAGISYTALSLAKPPQSKTGKVPYMLRDDGSILADSNVIIRTLARERGIDLEGGQTPEEQARAHAVLRLVEESLYFAGVWERWMLPASWPITRDGYFGALPGPMRTLFGGLVRRKIKAVLHGQGTLRYEPEEIVARGTADIRALSTLLGQQAWFHGERPGVADASAYGMLANVLAYPAATALKSAVEACPNLVAFCRRIENTYWPVPSTSGTTAIQQAADARAA